MEYCICSNIDESWEYQVSQNKSDRKGEEQYDFTYMWDMKQETNEQAKQTNW